MRIDPLMLSTAAVFTNTPYSVQFFDILLISLVAFVAIMDISDGDGDQIPFCYDGKDTNLREDPYCFACKHFHGHTVLSELKRCSRCMVAWYCSADCQKKHFKLHRVVCKDIADGIEAVEQEAISLRAYIDPLEGDTVPQNLFETRIGDFHDIDDADYYVMTRTQLARSYWEAAYDCEIKEVWEKSLFHCLEVLRLDYKISFEARFRLPFILLYLNRDDDAYSYARYRLSEHDVFELFERHQHSREGDWIYPIENDCRYRDIFEDCPDMDYAHNPEPFLLALAIIKMRIIAAHDAVSRAVDFVFERTTARRIVEVRSLVKDMLTRSDLDIDDQRDILVALLERIPPFVLTALRSLKDVCEVKQSLEMDDLTHCFASMSQSFPAGETLWSSARAFCRVPGAAGILKTWGDLDSHAHFS